MADKDVVTYRDAIAQSSLDWLENDPKAVIIGVGVADDRGIFGTTLPAHKKFPDRVIETPLSENMLTGALVGMAAEGWHPMLVHARADFLTLSAEHLINTAAKWKAIHGQDCPVTIRCIIGEGWGQGPTHSQAMISSFVGVPGIDAFFPASYPGIRRAITNAWKTGRTTIIFEHRRLYGEPVEYNLEAAADYSDGPQVNSGCFLSGVSASHLDAVQAGKLMNTDLKIMCPERALETLDDWPHRIVTDGSNTGVVIACPDRALGEILKARWMDAGRVGGWEPQIRVLVPPDYPCPTSAALEHEWYATFGVDAIVEAACDLMGVEPPKRTVQSPFATGEAF